MKLEPIRFLETSVEFYSKRGTSWHGTVVLQFREGDECDVCDERSTLAGDKHRRKRQCAGQLRGVLNI